MTEAVKSEIEVPQPSIWPEPLKEDFNDSEWPNFEVEDANILKWVTKNKKLLIRTITWNLCAKPPPAKEEFTASLLVKKFHVFIFGTEECERSIAQSAIIPSKKNWEQYLTECFGSEYLPVRSHTLQAIHVMAFVHRAIAPLCTVATSAAVATGVGNTLGNKGGVGIFLKIGSTRILVVNAHLSAHQNAVRQRNNDFLKIARQLPVLLERKDPTKEFYINSNNVSSNALNTLINKNETREKSKTPTVNDGSEDTEKAANSPSSVDQQQPQQGKSSIDELPPSILPPDQLLDENGMIQNDQSAPDKPSNEINNIGSVNDNGEDSDSDTEEQRSPRYSKSIPAESSSDMNLLGGKDLKQCAEVVIFMGDLNYRIKGNRSIIDRLIESNMHEVLLSNDQLCNSMAAGDVLTGFAEAPLNFKPTYKYDIGTNNYDSSSKRRIPSWTDRILYVPTPDLDCIAYNCENNISTSDHKPVYASFIVNTQLFVSLDENQNVILPTDLSPKFTSESQVCSIM